MPGGRPEEWTEDRACTFANELVHWMSKDENIFWERFVVIEKGMDPTTLSYLQRKFREKKYDESKPIDREKVKKRDEFFKAIKRAEKIQELKLADKAMDNRSVGGAVFLLKNKHGYADKQEVKQETRQINVDASSLASKSMEELLALQEELSRG